MPSPAEALDTDAEIGPHACLRQQRQQEGGSCEGTAGPRAALHSQQRGQQLAHALSVRLRHVCQVAAKQIVCLDMQLSSSLVIAEYA